MRRLEFKKTRYQNSKLVNYGKLEMRQKGLDIKLALKSSYFATVNTSSICLEKFN